MGAINLASGNIITLGYDEDYYTSDEELREWATEVFEVNEHLQEWYTLEGYIKLKAVEDYAEMIHDTVSDIYEWVKRDIDDTKIISEIINICIEPGYYSGFSVTVDIDKWNYFDDWEEKELALSEVKDVQELLNKLVDEYMDVVSPHWCTTWLNYEESKKAIKKAMAELRRKIKAIPCYSRYRKVV